MSEVRRATPKARSWRDTLRTLSSDKITDVETVSEPVEEPLFEEYPYSNQEIIKGRFTYLLYPPRDGDPTPIAMNFFFRTGSKLFILDPGRRDNLSDQVLFELRSLLTDKMSILPGSSVSRKGLWNFIQSAYEVREVTVRADPGQIESSGSERITEQEGVVSYEQLPSDPNVIGERKVERAELVFQFNGRFDVVYSDDILSVNGGDEQFEYAVQKFEAEAIFKG
ncbi:hypothetical protein VB773_04875 [Haloarculaceae archaeon H-GB2-1]|nr:hypothetical protein [Haloarculaceae archaeon H-GB1-1]MEA5406974.1 hypothetical protein [Haloarculaceae archaeon H-GB2-1]